MKSHDMPVIVMRKIALIYCIIPILGYSKGYNLY
ncbi:hypothetical protein FHS16_002362 [Paenibacillus endophyticus]|uniref:Uncharacterized protein n=1 Tax=Paenibacillus endophyticus TaxID=1294268 RepID=A0A7W5C742_9BACL|nr:hypothetical protein [Paenibacillus endophyticus]